MQEIWSLRSISWLIPTLLFSLTLSATFFDDRLLSTSVDIAHHAQMIDAIESWGAVPAEAAGYMREMYEYPNVAHRIAAILTKTGAGSLSTMLLLSASSVTLGWVVLFYLVSQVSIWALAAVFICAIALASTSHAMLGGELIGNFFFAQAVGEGILIGCTIIGAWLITNRRQLWFLLFSIASVYIACQTHLLPGVKLLIVFTSFQSLSIAYELYNTKRFNVFGFISLTILLITFILNSQVRYMVRLVDAGGGINFGFPATGIMMFSVALLLGLSAGMVLLLRTIHSIRFNNPGKSIHLTGISPVNAPLLIFGPLDILAILGIAAASPAILQFLLQVIKGSGSDYSVLKHFFGVLTLLVVILPTLVVVSIERLRRQPSSKLSTVKWSVGLPFVSAAVLMFVLFNRPSVVNVKYVDAITNAIENARDSRSINVMQDSSVFAASRLEPIVSYIASQSVLRHKRDQNSLSVSASGRPDDLSKETYIFTPLGDEAYDVPTCRVGETIKLTVGKPLVQVSATCLHQLNSGPKELTVGGTLAFKAGEGTSKYLIEGWSIPETNGVWSLAKRAVVTVPVHGVPRAGDYQIEVLTVGFIDPKSPSRTASLSVNGHVTPPFLYQLSNASHTFQHRLSAQDLASGQVHLEFSIPDAVSPKSLELSGDTRELGVGLLTIKLISAEAK